MRSRVASEYELFHIVDHSYSQLVHRLPAGRTIVTCHDLDTFRSVLIPEDEPRSAIFQMATRRILAGLKRAARVTCDTAAVREELLGFGLVPPERVSVVPVGVGDGFSPDADERADVAAARLVAGARSRRDPSRRQRQSAEARRLAARDLRGVGSVACPVCTWCVSADRSAPTSGG